MQMLGFAHPNSNPAAREDCKEDPFQLLNPDKADSRKEAGSRRTRGNVFILAES